MNSGHSSILVADYIVFEHGRFTPFRLNKLVYIAHGRTLAALDRPLIWDRIEAWKYGPCIPLLHHHLKRWDWSGVLGLTYCPNYTSIHGLRDMFNAELPGDERNIIDRTAIDYGEWTEHDLNRLCHEKGSPWDYRYDGKFGTEILDSDLKAYYSNELLTMHV